MATSVSKLIISLQKFSSKISKIVDATNSFNSLGYYYQDISGWDSATVQFLTPSEAISFFTTNDSGAISGQLLPAPQVPLNWYAVKGIDLATKGDVLSTSTNSNVEFGIIGKYLLLQGATTNNPFSYAYVLSHASASPFYACADGVSKGTRIVYASTATPTSVTAFYANSLLTQTINGTGSYHAFKLLTGSTLYTCIVNTGSISGVQACSGVTTTTTSTTTSTTTTSTTTTSTTTTAAPTTTTTAGPTTTTTAGPTTTTTTKAFYLYKISSNSAIDQGTACADGFLGGTLNVYASTNNGAVVTKFYTNSSLTTSFVGNGNAYAFMYNYPTGVAYAALINASGNLRATIAC